MVPAMATIEHYMASTVPVLADRARRVLEGSGLIALPTESFYGLAAAPFDKQALARLWQVKGRSEGKPILVLIGDESQLGPFVRSIPHAAHLLISAFWPGPLTIVFPAAGGLSDAVTAGTGSVGIRLSAWQPLRELLRRLKQALGNSYLLALDNTVWNGRVDPAIARRLSAALDQALAADAGNETDTALYALLDRQGRAGENRDDRGEQLDA